MLLPPPWFRMKCESNTGKNCKLSDLFILESQHQENVFLFSWYAWWHVKVVGQRSTYAKHIFKKSAEDHTFLLRVSLSNWLHSLLMFWVRAVLPHPCQVALSSSWQQNQWFLRHLLQTVQKSQFLGRFIKESP